MDFVLGQTVIAAEDILVGNTVYAYKGDRGYIVYVNSTEKTVGVYWYNGNDVLTDAQNLEVEDG